MLPPKDKDWIQKQNPYVHCLPEIQNPYMCCLQEISLKPRDTYRLRGARKIYFIQIGNQKKAGVAILIPDKIDFEIQNMIRDKERHYIIIKGSIQE